jgi:hypothetical protein
MTSAVKLCFDYQLQSEMKAGIDFVDQKERSVETGSKNIPNI